MILEVHSVRNPTPAEAIIPPQDMKPITVLDVVGLGLIKSLTSPENAPTSQLNIISHIRVMFIWIASACAEEEMWAVECRS